MWHWLFSLLRPAPPPTVQVQEPPPEFEQLPPPDWVIALKTWYLPGGGWHTARVALFTNGSAAPARFEAAAWPEPRHVQAHLDQAVVARLVGILDRQFPARYASAAVECIDGLPCEVTVYRREPFLGFRASCNLGDWLTAREQREVPGVAEIGLVFLEAVGQAFSEKAEPGAAPDRRPSP
jgi:hypothetical protein